MGTNIHIINKSGGFLSRGLHNIGIGSNVLVVQNGSLTGGYNIGMGKDLYYVQNGDMDGYYNIGIGKDSYYVNKGDIATAAKRNISLGNNNYRFDSPITSTFSGEGNIGIGNNVYNSQRGFSGKRNIGIGDEVFKIGQAYSSGSDNIGIGTSVMQPSGGIVGNYNIALGYRSLHTGGRIAGTDNIAIGSGVLRPNTNDDIGSYNIGIGNRALSDDMAKGNANIQIGNFGTGTPVAGRLNKVVAIGNEIINLNTTSTNSNVILLGKTGLDSPKIGMGTYKPQAKLDVNGGVRVANDTSTCTSANEGTTKKFQGCDGTNWVNLN